MGENEETMSNQINRLNLFVIKTGICRFNIHETEKLLLLLICKI